MLYRLVRPVKRKGSSNAHFAQRIPSDLRGRMAGMKLAIPVGDEIVPVTITDKMQSIRLSLKTSDPTEVKDRQAGVASYLEKVFRSLRENEPVSLSHRQTVHLSGILYRAWAKDPDDGQRISMVHTEDGWVRDDGFDAEQRREEYRSAIAHIESLGASGDTADLETAFGPIVDRLLLDKGIVDIDVHSRAMILEEFRTAFVQGLGVAERRAGGDYSPDPLAERFPEWPNSPSAPVRASVSLVGLVDGWWTEAQANNLSVSTHDSYSRAVRSLSEFLGHDDASKVTAEDIIRFKDHLLAPDPKTNRSLTPKTVNDNYLAGVRRVFAWAVTNRRMNSNPADGVEIKVRRKVRVRDSWFSREEVSAILSASMNAQRGRRESDQRFAMRRWVPWLCAYTGARVGEMVQLRKEDVRLEEGIWVIRITPEAGTVKGGQPRDVPVHPHLVDQGFPDFVNSAPDGHLFMWSGTDRAAWRTAKNRLTDFIRSIVTDKGVQPNHGWRHTFKTIGSEARISDRVLDAICGHKPRTVGETYGGVTIAAKFGALSMFPKYEINS